MPVGALVQDLLRNGIDLRALNGEDTPFRHSVSVVFGKKDVD